MSDHLLLLVYAITGATVGANPRVKPALAIPLALTLWAQGLPGLGFAVVGYAVCALFHGVFAWLASAHRRLN